LINALNALGGLLICTFVYYSYQLSTTSAPLSPRDTTRLLEPESKMLRLPDDHYTALLAVS